MLRELIWQLINGKRYKNVMDRVRDLVSNAIENETDDLVRYDSCTEYTAFFNIFSGDINNDEIRFDIFATIEEMDTGNPKLKLQSCFYDPKDKYNVARDAKEDDNVIYREDNIYNKIYGKEMFIPLNYVLFKSGIDTYIRSHLVGGDINGISKKTV